MSGYLSFPRRPFLLGLISLAASGALSLPAFAADDLPTLWLIGDSTMKNGTAGQQGWGDPFVAFFDPAKVKVVNRGRGGRSSRTFLTEGLWDAILTEMKPGDFVLMQFGHNDGGPMDEGRARASIHGNTDEEKEVTIKETGKKEVVHSYGWYLRRYIADARAKGATPIVLSPVPRDRWGTDGTVNRASGDYGKWASEAAKQGGASFVDLNEIIARRYEAIGKEKVAKLFTDSTTDRTHTSPDGAAFNAASVVSGLKDLHGLPLVGFFSDKAKEVEAAPESLVVIVAEKGTAK